MAWVRALRTVATFVGPAVITPLQFEFSQQYSQHDPCVVVSTFESFLLLFICVDVGGRGQNLLRWRDAIPLRKLCENRHHVILRLLALFVLKRS